MAAGGIITAVVAVYGAGLSTYTLLMQRHQQQRRVQVKLSNGFLTFGPDLSELHLLIEAANIGHVPVTVNGPGIFLPTGQQVVFPEPASNVTFPYQLAPGTSCTAWTEVSVLARHLAQHGLVRKLKLIGFYRDQTGQTFRSKPFMFDVDEWRAVTAQAS